jgi:hypothetical protein
MSCASVHVCPTLITVAQVTFHELQCDNHATGDCAMLCPLKEDWLQDLSLTMISYT